MSVLRQFPNHPAVPGRQRGMVLIVSLLLLVVVTLLAVSMLRSVGVDEKIAGNMREKQRALASAESAEQYAEWWLSQGNASQGLPCAAPLLQVSAAQVCSNPISASQIIQSTPWTIGVTYTPPNMTATTGLNGTSAIQQGSFYSPPTFYISYLGLYGSASNVQGFYYQIDAVGYGGNADTIGVVEAVYLVKAGGASNLDPTGG